MPIKYLEKNIRSCQLYEASIRIVYWHRSCISNTIPNSSGTQLADAILMPMNSANYLWLLRIASDTFKYLFYTMTRVKSLRLRSTIMELIDMSRK